MRQAWNSALDWSRADGSALANSTTETIAFPDVVIPGELMKDYKILRLTAFGRLSTTGTPTLTFRVRWGGVGGSLLCASGAMVTGSGVTAAMWMVQVLIFTRVNGASGSLFATGFARIGEDATSTVGSATNAGAHDLMGSAGVAAPAAVTVDLSANALLSLTAQWSAASASNTLTGHNYLLEELN